MTKPSYETCELPKSVVGWLVSHATKNYWRVSDWCEIDDLIQDGLMVAYRCKQRYGEPGVTIDHPHFMALVKTAFYRHITDILRDSRATQEWVSRTGDLAGEMSEDEFLDRNAGGLDPVQHLAALITKAPATLRQAVELHLKTPEKMRRGRVCLNGPNETEKQLLYRLTKFPKRRDFEDDLREYLGIGRAVTSVD